MMEQEYTNIDIDGKGPWNNKYSKNQNDDNYLPKKIGEYYV